jgi:hypothetical protein
MEQTEFQKIMGEMEVLGELIIKRESDMKKMASGGLTAGRWYKDNSGSEYRFIGEDSEGKAIFSDGERNVVKSLDDFDNGAPKEHKLFKFFKDGGQMS